MHTVVLGKLESCMKVIQSRGQLHQRMVTIVMNGLPRAGKTTTKERLLGRIQQLLEMSPSTGVVEPSLKVTMSELPRSSGMVSGSQWTVLSLNDESLNLVSAILQAAGDLKSQSRLASVISDITRAFKGKPTNPNSRLSSSGASNHPPLPPSTSTQLEASKATAANVGVTRPDQLLDAVLTKQWDKLHASLEDATVVHFIDTGGQPEFQEILPALLSGHSISILLFKLHEKLKQRYQVEYVSRDGTKSEPYTASCTVEDVLFQSLATVACYGSETTDPTQSGSVALLVGTHKDLATEADIQSAEKSLKEKIENAEYFEKNLVHYPFPSKLIFPLDNTQDADIQTLRRVLEDIIHKRFPRLSLPAPWLLFEIALRKAGVKIITMKDCQKIAKCYGVTSKKELKEALRFLHRMCMVRYYPDVKEVKNLIICDLQVLFDAITNIIVYTFTFEKVGQAGVQKFRNTGKFSLQEFQQLATSKCPNELLPPEKLVKLLEHLHILVPVHEAGCDEYFMPCVLQTEDLHDTTVHSLPYPPLIISFECGYCPVGAFSALIVYLLQHSQEKSSTLKWKIPHGATVYRNKIDFRVGHYLDKVKMIAMPTYFEVQYDCSASHLHTPVHKVCSHIREDILDGLAVVIRSRNYTCKTAPLIGFYCPRPQCTSSQHIAICEGKNPSVMECISSKEPIGLLSRHFIWFGKVSFLKYSPIVQVCFQYYPCGLQDHSLTTHKEQAVPIPSPQLEGASSSLLQDSTGMIRISNFAQSYL